MTTETVITKAFYVMIQVLTPQQRWQALKEFETTLTFQRLLALIGVAALIILVLLLIWVSYKRTNEERKINEKLFFNSSKRLGLSEHERQILLQVVKKSGLKQKDAIFSMEDAFLRGAGKLIDESIAARPDSLKSAHQKAEENEKLISDLASLREKLGFLPYGATNLKTTSKKLSTRQIPVGTMLQITPHKTPRSAGLESEVIQNNNIEITLKLKTPVQSEPGTRWNARFNSVTSVWEFDSSVVCCDGNVLVLRHSDDIRFINRRRFARTKVNKPAFVACLPFVKVHNSRLTGVSPETTHRAEQTEQRSIGDSISSWGIPEFVPAVVTELAGVSLCLDVPLNVKLGERLIIIFKLDEERNRDAGSQKNSKTTTSKIIQNIGEVKSTKAIENGQSIVVELIGLSDSEVSKLVRATNSALAKSETASQPAEDEPDKVQSSTSLDGNQQNTEKDALEQASVQGA
jgi:hypothetical protein